MKRQKDIWDNSDLRGFIYRNRETLYDDLVTGKYDPKPLPPEPPKAQTTLFADSELDRITKVKRKFKKPV